MVDDLMLAVETHFVEPPRREMDGHAIIGPPHYNLWMAREWHVEPSNATLRGYPVVNVGRDTLVWVQLAKEDPVRCPTQPTTLNQMGHLVR